MLYNDSHIQALENPQRRVLLLYLCLGWFCLFWLCGFVNCSGLPLTGMCYEGGEKQFLMEAVRDLLCWIIGGRKPHVVRQKDG